MSDSIGFPDHPRYLPSTGYANPETQDYFNKEIYAKTYTNTIDKASEDLVNERGTKEKIRNPANENLDYLLDFAQKALSVKAKKTSAATDRNHGHHIARWATGAAEFVNRKSRMASTRITLTSAPTSAFGDFEHPSQGSQPILIAEDTRNLAVSPIAFRLTEEQAADIRSDMLSFAITPKRPLDFAQKPEKADRYGDTLAKYLVPCDSDGRKKQIVKWNLKDARYRHPSEDTGQFTQHQRELVGDMLSHDPMEAAILRRERTARVNEQGDTNGDALSETQGDMIHHETDIDAIVDMTRATLDPNYSSSSELDKKWNSTRHYGENTAQSDLNARVNVIEARSAHPHNPWSVSVALPTHATKSSLAFSKHYSLDVKDVRPRAIVSFRQGATERSLSLPLSESLARYLDSQQAKIEYHNGAPSSFSDDPDANAKFCENLNRSQRQVNYDEDEKITWRPEDMSWHT